MPRTRRKRIVLETRSFKAPELGSKGRDMWYRSPQPYRVTMQLEHVLCGKRRCTKLHGPYWYAYREQDGRTVSVYVGKVYDEKKAVKRLWAKLEGA